MKILGISAFYHDSAACIVEDGEIISAAQEERFTRLKFDASFPSNAIKYCLENARNIDQPLDAIAFYDKPFLKFERLLETYYAYSPKGWLSFINAMPSWLGQKLYLKSVIRKELKKITGQNYKDVKILFPEHHLSHLASSYYPSGFDRSALISVDGVGEWATATIAKAEGKEITVLKEMHFPHSLGLLYSAFTYFLGFRVNSDEYKVMGLAPYGNSGSEHYKKLWEQVMDHLLEIRDDGSLWLNPSYFDYSTGMKMIKESKWESLFNLSKRKSSDELKQEHCNIALIVQNLTEDVILKMAEEAKRLTGMENLCLSGGVALNCVANGKIVNSGLFKKVYIQPAAGDAGGAVGAALAACHIYFRGDKIDFQDKDGMKGSYLGPEFSDVDILPILSKLCIPYLRYDDFDNLITEAAKRLADGKIAGWFRGRMEFGPRALGNRSILADPRNREMQKELNLKTKFRESFRPFAPAVTAEDASQYFELKSDSPYMLLTADVVPEKRKPLPSGYENLHWREKLNTVLSDLPAITHVDFSARVQTVHKDTNPDFHSLLMKFKELTSCSVLVNTSFNVNNEPIVCNPQDAVNCFINTNIDFLVIGNFIVDKA